MKALAFSKEMKRIDQLAVQGGISEEILMENAGNVATQVLIERAGERLNTGRTLIVVGPGHNGGDAMVVARHLSQAGYANLDILLTVDSSNFDQLCRLQFDRIKNLNFIKTPLSSSYSVIVDGIFGIGLSKNISDSILNLIETCNQMDAYRFALDTPSGLNVDTGCVMGGCFHADMTVTFGLAKPGFYIQDGPRVTGDLVIKNIGFAQVFLKNTSVQLLEQEDFKNLPMESDRTHKSKRGKLLVIAGSQDYWGAGLLACRAALRAGAGYVYWASHQNPFQNLLEQPELIVRDLKDIQDFSSFDAIVVGPGLGVSEDTFKLLKKINNDKVIVDADALNSLKFGNALKPNWIVTPHTGELSRLIHQSSEDIELNKFEAMELFKSQYGCSILLKGFRTLVFSQKFTIIHSGNKALAKAGAGDVLAGIIGAFASQGLGLDMSACLGAFLHGWVADQWVGNKSPRSLTPSDLIQELPQALKTLESHGA